MELFNKFKETVFLKSDSNLEKTIEKLKEKQYDHSKNSEINQDLKLLEMGLKGEKEIEFELKNANIGMYVLHDINIEFEDLKAQIDYIIVTKAYTYLVECKNMIGNVTVNSNGEFKRDYYLNNKRIIEGIYSPYRQAMRHKEVLKKIWLSKNNKLNQFLYEKTFDKVYKPLVVLTNSKGLLNIKYAPKEIKSITIRSDNLIEYIKKDIDNFDKGGYSSNKKMYELAVSILNNNCENNNAFSKYEARIEDNNHLIERLKEYRKEKSKRKNIPAYYIFTDKELDMLIAQKPKSYEELLELKILNSTKLRLHGIEIVKIINESH